MNDIKQIQIVILNIIKEIDKICIRNNIDYYLIGGSTLGAIRHQGFIPWDDDLDIVLTDDNYKQLLKALKEQLDPELYIIQEGMKDWPLYYSKVILKGTNISKNKLYSEEVNGAFLDIFKLDNVPNNHISAIWQYFLAKYFLSYTLRERNYKTNSILKIMMMGLAIPLKVTFIRSFILHQIEKYNRIDTKYIGFFYGRTRFKSAIMQKKIYGKPIRMKFEDTELPIQENYHKYLKLTFGDYMTMPPIEKRLPSHFMY